MLTLGYDRLRRLGGESSELHQVDVMYISAYIAGPFCVHVLAAAVTTAQLLRNVASLACTLHCFSCHR